VELEQVLILQIVAKKGTKRSILTDAKGIPLSVVVDGANRHDKMLVKKTFDALIFERPSPDDITQNICMDKGYDYSDIRELVKNYGYTAHIRSRGEENIKIQVLGQEGGLRKDTFLAEQI
jgi:putative transposase